MIFLYSVASKLKGGEGSVLAKPLCGKHNIFYLTFCGIKINCKCMKYKVLFRAGSLNHLVLPTAATDATATASAFNNIWIL